MTMNQNDHDQIIDQVISLENDFSDASSAMAAGVSNVDNNNLGVITSDPIVTTTSATMTQHQHSTSIGDLNQTITGIQQHPNQQHSPHQQPCVMPIDNDYNDRSRLQLSSSSEDLLNLLLEFDRDSSNLISGVHPLDQDEKTGIEAIRKQLMSCEVQSEQLQQQLHNESMSPMAMNPMTCHPHQQQPQHPRLTPTQHQSQHHAQQMISQTAPVVTQHQQHPSLANPSLSQQQQRQQLPQHHQRLSVDQSLLNGPYNATTVNYVPVPTSSQVYTPQQHQNVTIVNQSNSISMVNNSPSPSWQQNQQPMSPFSPQQNHHHHHHHQQQQQQQQTPPHRQNHPTTAASSPQLHQQLQQHHSLHQQKSPSQSVSPPVTTTTTSINVATTEPSPVVKKNPLLNAQLVNSRAPSLTPTRFLGNQTNVLNQNPILNSKLSQNPFRTSNSPNTCGSPVNPSLNSQQQPNRFLQQQQPQQVASTFGYDISHQQHHGHQQTVAQAAGHMSVYGQSSNQTTNQMYRSANPNSAGISTGATSPPVGLQSPMMGIGDNTSQCNNLSQQVKQEIRRKVQQPKQPQHQTTSLLKQLLSDDNK